MWNEWLRSTTEDSDRRRGHNQYDHTHTHTRWTWCHHLNILKSHIHTHTDKTWCHQRSSYTYLCVVFPQPLILAVLRASRYMHTYTHTYIRNTYIHQDTYIHTSVAVPVRGVSAATHPCCPEGLEAPKTRWSLLQLRWSCVGWRAHCLRACCCWMCCCCALLLDAAIHPARRCGVPQSHPRRTARVHELERGDQCNKI